jgi:hypothetical protein
VMFKNKKASGECYLNFAIRNAEISLSKILGDVHKIRNALGGRGQRFVTNHCKYIGICTVLRYEGEGGLKSRKIALRNLWTSPWRILR